MATPQGEQGQHREWQEARGQPGAPRARPPAPRPQIRSPGWQGVEVPRRAETEADQAPLGMPWEVPG